MVPTDLAAGHGIQPHIYRAQPQLDLGSGSHRDPRGPPDHPAGPESGFISTAPNSRRSGRPVPPRHRRGPVGSGTLPGPPRAGGLELQYPRTGALSY